MLLLKSEEKLIVAVTSFSNDESARPTTLKQSPPQPFSLNNVTNFKTAILKNTCERFLQFYKKHIRYFTLSFYHTGLYIGRCMKEASY